MEISLVFRVHPSEDILEEYAFGRLSGDRLRNVEEHLLVCEACQLALEHAEQYIRLVKTAACIPLEPPRLGFLAGIRNALGARMRMPAAARVPAAVHVPAAAWMGGLAAACLITAVVFLSPGFSALPAAVSLQSYRGDAAPRGEDTGINLGPALRPLDFAIRAEDVPKKSGYRLEAVTDDGRVLWSGGAKRVDPELTAHMQRGLSAGHYWVRLYDQDSVLLSEFGLQLK